MQTITIREAETQLQSLVKQAQTTRQSVILTNEIATPVAVLTFFDPETTDQNASVMRRLEILASILHMWQQYEEDHQISQDTAHLFQSQLRQLSMTAVDRPPVFGALLMLLRLAAGQLTLPISPSQVQALAAGVDALQSPTLGWTQLETVDRQLLESGIDTRADWGNDELVNAYVDAS